MNKKGLAIALIALAFGVLGQVKANKPDWAKGPGKPGGMEMQYPPALSGYVEEQPWKKGAKKGRAEQAYPHLPAVMQGERGGLGDPFLPVPPQYDRPGRSDTAPGIRGTAPGKICWRRYRGHNRGRFNKFKLRFLRWIKQYLDDHLPDDGGRPGDDGGQPGGGGRGDGGGQRQEGDGGDRGTRP